MGDGVKVHGHIRAATGQVNRRVRPCFFAVVFRKTALLAVNGPAAGERLAGKTTFGMTGLHGSVRKGTVVKPKVRCIGPDLDVAKILHAGLLSAIHMIVLSVFVTSQG